MKVAFIYDAVYPYVIGGVEKYNFEIAKRLAREGHEVTIVGMKYWQGENELKVENVSIRGICKAVPLYDKRGKRSVTEPFYFGVHVFFHLMNNDYDVIDCANFPYVSCIAGKLAVLLKGASKKTRFMITWYEVWGIEYWLSYSRYLGIFGYLLEKLTAGISSLNITKSEFTKERAVRILKMQPDGICVIPNSIEFDSCRKIQARIKADQVVFAGRLIPHKRAEVLIQVFKDVLCDKATAHLSALRLKIIGRGPRREALIALAGELGIAKQVDFIEFMPSPAFEEEIKKSKVFVLPSEREGFGIVILEAMALGTAVVANDSENSAARYIITTGVDGLTYKDAEGLKSHVIRLLTDEEFNRNIVEKGLVTSAGYDTDGGTMPKVRRYYFGA